MRIKNKNRLVLVESSTKILYTSVVSRTIEVILKFYFVTGDEIMILGTAIN